jgi:tetratricopeptide (TPR) repeat protein
MIGNPNLRSDNQLMRLLLMPLLFICCTLVSQGQYKLWEATAKAEIENARDQASKVSALGELAELYYIFRSGSKGDSVLQKQLATAELSNNKELVLKVLFSNAIAHIESWTSSETFDRALLFLDKGLAYAKELNRNDYEAIAHARKAALYRKRSQFESALKEASMALTLSGAADDSLKIITHLELGDVFAAQGDAISAFKNYNVAYDLSYRSHNNALRSEVYHHFAWLYHSLGDRDLARTKLLESLDLNQQTGNSTRRVQDYIELARITDEAIFIERALALSDSLAQPKFRLHAQRLMLAYLMVIKKERGAALDYLQGSEDLQQYYKHEGQGGYYYKLGNIYHYSGQQDSAIAYYQKAEPLMSQSFDQSVRMLMYKDMGDCYAELNQTASALQFYTKAMDIGKQTSNFNFLANTSLSLSKLYERAGAFDKGYTSLKEYLHYKDTLQKMASQRELVLLELERLNKKHEKDILDETALQAKKRDLQYLGISISITLVFLFLTITGMFPVSIKWIRIVNFFAFICLFEFIILLADSYIHHITNGDALQIWLIKTGLLAIILPLHHYLEHVMIQFLQSQKLVSLREQLRIKNPLKKKEKPAPAEAGPVS